MVGELLLIGRRSQITLNAVLFPNASRRALPQALLTFPFLASTSLVFFLDAERQLVL